MRAALPSAPDAIGSSSYNLLARALLAVTDAEEKPRIHDLNIRPFGGNLLNH